MRIAVAEIAQETDSFSPLTADLKDFESNGLYFGHDILERMPGIGPVGGFLEVAAEQMAPVDILPIIRAWGSAGGTISEETLEFLTARLVEGLKQSLPLDGVCYLADAEGAEVYLAHHHDKVVVSIPDVATRQPLLQELTDAAWLFEDASGYASTIDDEPES